MDSSTGGPPNGANARVINMETIKKISINANVTVSVTYAAWIDSGNINADGDTISTGQEKFVESVSVAMTANGKTFRCRCPRLLSADNKFDAPVIKKGAVAMVGAQPISQDTYNKIMDLIAAAKNATMTEELIAAEKNTAAIKAVAANDLVEEIKADSRHDARIQAIYKIMDSSENR